MASIKPGGMGSGADPDSKPPEFAGSMAEAMENALNELLSADEIKTFKVNTNSREARDRRRLFVAIAQGIVRHLQGANNTFQIVNSTNTQSGETIVVGTRKS